MGHRVDRAQGHDNGRRHHQQQDAREDSPQQWPDLADLGDHPAGAAEPGDDRQGESGQQKRLRLSSRDIQESDHQAQHNQRRR